MSTRNAEMFGGMWKLREYFNEMDRIIKKFDQNEGKNPAVEEIKEKRKKLWKTAKEMDRTDLQLLYYLHQLDKIYPYYVLHSLQKLFNAQCELKNLIEGSEEYQDPFEERENADGLEI